MLPGGNTWDRPEQGAIIRKAAELLSAGATVCAICGATVALAGAGLLNDRLHTSNGEGFLDMMCPGYKGQRHYVAAPSVADGNLITASGTGALLWAKQIIERLGVPLFWKGQCTVSHGLPAEESSVKLINPLLTSR